MLQDLNKSPTVYVCVCVLRHDYVQRVMTCCRVTQYVRLCQRMYKNTNSPNWMAHRGWSQCTSRFWVPLPARPPESSPRACPRWRSWWILPHSHFCPWLVGAPPERLHVTKLVPVTTAVFCFVFLQCQCMFKSTCMLKERFSLADLVKMVLIMKILVEGSKACCLFSTQLQVLYTVQV